MAVVEFEDPFDDSFEDILSSLFEQVETLWPDPDERPDLREGSLMYTLLSPVAFEIQRLQTDLNYALELGFLQFTFGDFLDLKGSEFGLSRKQGSESSGILRFLGDIGTSVPIGTTASNIIENEDDEVYLFDTTNSGIIEGISDPVSINEQQKISVSGTGRFTLTLDGSTTVPLDPDDTGGAIAAALTALQSSLTPPPSYPSYSVSGDSGIANAGGATVAFDDGDVAGADIPKLVAAQYKRNEKQNIKITGSGDFKLKFGSETTGTLNQTSTGLDVKNVLNALLGLNGITVDSEGAGVSSPSGVTVEFSGDTEYEDVVLLEAVNKTGSISETIVVTQSAEDSNAEVTVTEVVKGRRGEPLITITDQNEIQKVSYTLPEVEVETQVSGVVGPNNQIWELEFTGSPVGGTFTLSFTSPGGGTDTTPPITYPTTSSTIQTQLVYLSNIGSSGDVLVTEVSANVFTVEFKGNLRNQDESVLAVASSALLPSGVAQVSKLTAGVPGANEVQVIKFKDKDPGAGFGPVPDSGSISFTLEDNEGTGPSIVGPIAHDASAGEILELFETSGDYGGGPTDNFIVSGSLLSSSGLKVEYAGKNSSKNFKPVLVSVLGTSTAPTFGSYKLVYNSSNTNPISYDATTDEIETELNTVLGGLVPPTSATVRVANGIQTLKFTGYPPTDSYQLTVDDGVTSVTTPALSTANSPSDVKNALEALGNVGLGNIEVEASGGSTLNDGATFIIYFLNSNVKLYRHMISSNASVVVGPTLSEEGAAYDILFDDVGSRSLFQYTDSTLVPDEDAPSITKLLEGSPTQQERQILSLTRPAGFFSLKFGSGDNTTALISPKLDTATSIQHKLCSLTDIGLAGVTVTGGPLATSAIFVEFSGPTLSDANQPMLEVTNNFLTGGYLKPVEEIQPGFGGSGGNITGTVQYVYTVVSELGVQDSPSDSDYEQGFGETASSTESLPLVVTNNKVLVKIAPITSGTGLTTPRKVNVYRKLTTGFTSTPYRLIGSISNSDLKLVDPDDTENVPPDMTLEDTLSLSQFNSEIRTAPGSNTTGVYEVEAVAQEIGFEQNLPKRAIQVLEDTIPGVVKVTNPATFGGGADIESDDDYRDRLIEYIQKDPGAGNIDDYISWAKEVDGVSGATVIPEWQEIYGPLEGPGTVKVIVSGENSTTLPDAVIEAVRSYICGSLAIPDPDTEYGPSTLAISGGDIEDGTYEYVYTFINSGKGETAPSAPSQVIVGDSKNSVEIKIEKGQGGIGPQNTIGRRVYRRKIDGAVTGEPDSEKFCLVAEILDNLTTTYTDTLEFVNLPTWLGYPNGAYERRKAPVVNSTSLFNGKSPIGAHVTVQSISEETVWIGATIYPASGYSIDGSGGKQNITAGLHQALIDFFKTLEAGQDVKYVDVANVLHTYAGVYDFKDLTLYSPVYPTGTTANIAIGSGISAQYSASGTFSLWTNYPYDI